MKSLRIATRQSILALWQTHFVRDSLQQYHPNLKIEIVGITTTGDKVVDKPLANIGGKGLFIKELEQALLDDKADIAVHSMKDVPPSLPADLRVAAILARADVRDAFVSVNYSHFNDLPQGATIGTCSVRRAAQCLALRPDLNIKSLRGNVNTRIEKLEAGEFDAIILAAAGLQRLEKTALIRHYFDIDHFLPSVAQGAIGIECRSDDEKTDELVQCLNDHNSQLCVEVERAVIRGLDGNCHSPIGVYAQLGGEALKLQAVVLSADGTKRIQHCLHGAVARADNLSTLMVEYLLQSGAKEFLES